MGNLNTCFYTEPGAAPQNIYHGVCFRTICERAMEWFILPDSVEPG